MLAVVEKPQSYCFGGNHPELYLTYTEMRIALGLLRRKFIAQIAADIGISERSVDYHCQRMMKLTDSRDFFEFLACLRNSDIE